MIAATPTLIAFMESARACRRVDLYTLTLPTGTVLRWAADNADVRLPAPDGRLFVRGPLLSRNRLELRAGIEVDQLQLDITPTAADLIGSTPLLRYAREGGLRGVELLLEWAYFSVEGVFQGLLPKFSGRGSPSTYEGGTLTLQVKSELERLLTQMPREIYQPTCLNTVYDAGCGKARSSMRVTGVVASSASRSIVSTALGQAAGWFDKGLLRFTSGANAGEARTVRGFTGGIFSFALPFPRDIAPGDAFEAFPGCDGSQATCTAKFANLARFRGQPYIPVPETTT